MKSFRLLSLCSLLIAGGLLLGCENQLEAPEAMTLQTKNAVDVLPAGAQLVGMMDLQAMQRNTAFDPFGDLNNMSDEVGARVQEFIDATGFDPKEDLREVYFAAPALGADAQASLVAYVTFDREALQDYVEQRRGELFDRSDYKGVPIYRALRDGRPFAFALASENMIVASPDEAAVGAMLDRLAGIGQALKDNAETMKLIALASSGSSAWTVVRDVADLGAHPSKHQDAVERDVAQIGRALKNVAIAVTMQEDGVAGKVFMQTKDGVAASDVADLTKGVVAAMKAESDIDAEKLRLLDRVRVRTQSDHVQVEFFADNALLNPSQ